MPKVAGLIVAGGSGQRVGGPTPKQYLHVRGRSLLAHAAGALAQHPAIGPVQVVIGAEDRAAYAAATAGLDLLPPITGGATRQASVLAGLEALAALPAPPRLVLIHDAARPLLPPAVIDRLLAALEIHVGAIPAIAVADSLKRDENGLAGPPVERAGLVQAQTPQAFHFAPILAAHRAAARETAHGAPSGPLTDDAAVAAGAGLAVVLVEGSPLLHKVTKPADLELIERLMTVPTPAPAARPAEPSASLSPAARPAEPSASPSPAAHPAEPSASLSPAARPAEPSASLSPAARPAEPSASPSPAAHPAEPSAASVTGFGFDVHAFGPGDHVTLAGVRIPHTRGLVGHSDADVALHALTDALLGTIGAGDIGQHFPPSDPRWKGADSARFLAHALDLVRAAGGRPLHIDLTLVAETPKIGPHRAAMLARLAELTGLPPDRIGLKATTSEQLGFTGRGEGIVAHAVATVWRTFP